MKYQVEFLDHDSFEALPYPDMEMSVGVADPRTQKAFVRKSGMALLDVFNAAHELEHLEDGQKGTHADHYRNGVYYKNFGNVAESAMPFLGNLLLPGIGGSIGGQMANMAWQPGGLASKVGLPAAQGPKAPNQNSSVMDQFQSAPQAPMPEMPNVVQANGMGAGGSGAGGQSGGGIVPQINQQLYGNYSGRG